VFYVRLDNSLENTMKTFFDNSETDINFEIVIEEYVLWLRDVTQVMQGIMGVSALPEPPETLLAWTKKEHDNQYYNQALLEAFQQVHMNLKVQKSYIHECLNTNTPFEKDGMDQFFSEYNMVLSLVHAIAQDVQTVNFGYDLETGLLNEKVMFEDLSSELERRAREGNPFCLILAHIDHWSEMVKELEAEDRKMVMMKVSELIRQCVRRFDDAYRLRDGDFVMSLKQTKTTGGSSAVNRLKAMLEETGLEVEYKGQAIKLVMSFCLSEPVPGDTLQDLVENMQADMQKITQEEDGASLEYIERSPLERYLDDSASS